MLKGIVTYLGDGVYASYDGYHVILTTNSPNLNKATNIIYLDSETRKSLIDYIEKGEPREHIKTSSK